MGRELVWGESWYGGQAGVGGELVSQDSESTV